MGGNNPAYFLSPPSSPLNVYHEREDARVQHETHRTRRLVLMRKLDALPNLAFVFCVTVQDNLVEMKTDSNQNWSKYWFSDCIYTHTHTQLCCHSRFSVQTLSRFSEALKSTRRKARYICHCKQPGEWLHLTNLTPQTLKLRSGCIFHPSK